MMQFFWQFVFVALVFGAAVTSGIAVISSVLRYRGQPRGVKRRDTPREIMLICSGFVCMAMAFFVAATKVFP
ncbi:hypothetical protein DEJ23_13670 [Curtobacterium sp. MCSS17_008]|nr:hypothetical protein DEJ23_13670 [Curtobacterium sp. MCSS17_008]